MVHLQASTRRFRSAAKLWTLAVVIAIAAVFLAQDNQPAGASHTHIFLTKSLSNPSSVGVVIVTPTTTAQLYVWVQNPHDPVWDTGIGFFEVDVLFEPDIAPITAIVENTAWLGSSGRAVGCEPAVIGPDPGADPGDPWQADVGCRTLGAPPPSGFFGVGTSGLLATLTFGPGSGFGLYNLINRSVVGTPGYVVPASGGPEQSQCAEGNATDDDIDGRVNDGCPAVGDPEFFRCGAITNPDLTLKGIDDDSADNDGVVNDGCPVQGGVSEPLTRCNDDVDDDGDGRVNDGCPQQGPASETGSQCTNILDEDSDGFVNDGCPPFGVPAETGSQCANDTDDDGDGSVNDGCPQVGNITEADIEYFCANSTDDDGDLFVNDGCAGLGPAEFEQCGNLVDDDFDGAPDDGCLVEAKEVPVTLGTVQVRFVRCADLNGDGGVALADFLAVLLHYGENPNSPGWDSNIDLNGDGAISLSDFLAVLAQYGSVC